MKKRIISLSILCSFSANSAELELEQLYSYHASWTEAKHWTRDITQSGAYMIPNGHNQEQARFKGSAFSGWTSKGLQPLGEDDIVPKTNAYHFIDQDTQVNTQGNTYSAAFKSQSDELESGKISFTIAPKESGRYTARIFTHTFLGGYGIEACQHDVCNNIQLTQGTIPYTSQRTTINFYYEDSPVQVNIFRRLGSGNDSRKQINFNAVVLYKDN